MEMYLEKIYIYRIQIILKSSINVLTAVFSDI